MDDNNSDVDADEVAEVITEEDLVGAELIQLDTGEVSSGDEEHEGDSAAMDTGHTEHEQPVFPATSDFCKHTHDVFTVDISGIAVASGGEDDKAFVWNALSADVLLTCEGHKDSVTWVRFNAKGSLLATADMSGFVQIWDVESLSCKTTFETGDLEWILWHNVADILLIGTKEGLVYMWLVPSNECKIFCGLGSACSVGVLLPGGKKVCAGYEDGSVLIHDLRESRYSAISIPKNQVFPIVSMCVVEGGNLGACGLSNGLCHVFNCESGKVVTTFACSPNTDVVRDAGDDEEDAPASVEAVAFSPNASFLCTATVSGECRLWNLSTNVLRQTLEHSAGIVKVLWNGDTITTGCLDGFVRLWDSRSGCLLRVFQGHSGEVLDFVLSKDGRFLVTAGADKTCKCFSLNSEAVLAVR